jgi:hypothetical protein
MLSIASACSFPSLKDGGDVSAGLLLMSFLPCKHYASLTSDGVLCEYIKRRFARENDFSFAMRYARL